MRKHRPRLSLARRVASASLLLALAAWPAAGQEPGNGAVPQPPIPAPVCLRDVYANVVAIDQVYFWNRLGAFEPQGMVYALERDVVHPSFNQDTCTGPAPSSGNAVLRRDRRPRPLVLRMNVGDCLHIRFKNWLHAAPVDEEQPHTRAASIHVAGMQYVSSITDGGINIGQNAAGGVVNPGGTANYTLYAQAEGGFLMYSGGAMVGGEGEGGSISPGLFGAVNVEPRQAEWYRSQVTRKDLGAATASSLATFPLIDYDAAYTAGNAPYCGAAGLPVLKMLGAGNNVVHSDLTAIITGPGRGPFPTGPPPAGPFFPVNNILLNRERPYRELTVIFHDEIGAVQAFPHFEDEVLAHTLHGARDAFAVNYGTGGAGAEVLANRLGVGPMHKCVECLYEEFFLSSWAVGDPAMVVDKPANHACSLSDLRSGKNCTPAPGPKATKAFFPDDPSNTYHSYLNDHLKFRNLHAGIEDHHIFHLHAHQWLHTPQSDTSAYHDSQAIGQGSAWTYEIAYGGSGNRNETVGDAIFHCHFYPHFAQGMWGLWRVHDVLEVGTQLDANGKPAHLIDSGGNVHTITRALPDGEIATGTPIPAIVPIPGQAMAPLPGAINLVNGDIDTSTTPATNPGYPFFIAGKAGHRPPKPPLDTLFDGGLPRHLVVAGRVAVEQHNRLSFDKELDRITPLWLPEAGTPIEQLAMSFHRQGSHPTKFPDGTNATFVVNNRPPVRGAPFADPCDDPNVAPSEAPKPPAISNRPVDRTYKSANIQMDVVLNKEGWHFPQQRLSTLWEDVNPTLFAQRPPEPLIFRAEDGECIEFQTTNLMPKTYELDDFEVRTPTDVTGQHIHLVKFDVTASDGAGNGFNYEDGAFSAEEVQGRIKSIRAQNGCAPLAFDPYPYTSPTCPRAQNHPFFTPTGIDANCNGIDDWLGAQINVQRWWADPVKDNAGKSRTLRTVFTHDHFGPSTHQQVGLYAGLIIEPAGSTWYHNEDNVQLSTGRADGGPTSWQARITDIPEEFREFAVEFADFQHGYDADGKFPSAGDGQLQLVCPDPNHLKGYADPDAAINPPAREELPPPVLYAKINECPLEECDPDGPIPDTLIPGDAVRAPCPESFSAADPGFVSVNYRSEPIALRVRNPTTNQQTAGVAGDLSFAYESRTDRADPLLNGVSSPKVPYPDLTGGLVPGDPFTPLLRAYEEDPVTMRVLIGAHEEEHNFNFNGTRWLREPDDLNSGWRGSQMMGISEWFDFLIRRVPSLTLGRSADFLYKPSASVQFQWDGAWGLMRLYRGEVNDLPVLASNADALGLSPEEDEALFSDRSIARPIGPDTDIGAVDQAAGKATTGGQLPPVVQPTNCPPGTTTRPYDITAIAASTGLTGGTLIYNHREDPVSFLPPSPGVCPADPLPSPTPGGENGPLHDPTAILFVRTADLTPAGVLKPGINPEPLVLRANAGECIQVTLRNAIPANYADLPGWSGVHMIVEGFNANDVDPSLSVGLHPMLVSYDVLQSDAMNVGRNRTISGLTQTVGPGQFITYYWYAGMLVKAANGSIVQRPVEYGVIPLISSDPIKHSVKAAVGAIVIEPAGSTWAEHKIFKFNDPAENQVKTYASATVTPAATDPFQEYVLVFQTDVNMRFKDGTAVPNNPVVVDPTESGQRAFNYRTEPVWFRQGYHPQTPPERTREETDFHLVFFNSFTGTEPETPLFTAGVGDRFRFRVTEPVGNTQNHVFELHGHLFQEAPFVTEDKTPSKHIGNNPKSNWLGSIPGIGTGAHFNALPGAAGGAFGILGDYMYRSYNPWAVNDGDWGILRVSTQGPTPADDTSVDDVAAEGAVVGDATASGGGQ